MIGLIGNGSWATAIAKILTDNGHKIKWWMRSQKAMRSLQRKQTNYTYLSSVVFSPNLFEVTNDLEEVLEACDILIMCVPSAYLLDVLKPMSEDALNRKIVISAVKGILPNEYLMLHDYLIKNHGLSRENYVSITGPCHAEEVATERLSYLTFSSENELLAERIAGHFSNEYMNTTVSTDIEGTQYASVLKNIYAVGAGMAHGMGYGDNFLSVFVTNCYKELNQFVKQEFKVNAEARHTSAYLGDLLVTCYSLHSRNRRFGTLVGAGYAIPAAIAEMGMMAEGYHATQGMHYIVKRLESELPIVEILYRVMWKGEHIETAFTEIESLLQ